MARLFINQGAFISKDEVGKPEKTPKFPTGCGLISNCPRKPLIPVFHRKKFDSNPVSANRKKSYIWRILLSESEFFLF
jgi:hypothetical protein